jgi:uncharacterized protein (DUF2384 family)
MSEEDSDRMGKEINSSAPPSPTPRDSEVPDESLNARVTARAQQVFSGKPEYAADWLRSAKSALGDSTPIQALSTVSGALAVEELLVGIEYGLFA